MLTLFCSHTAIVDDSFSAAAKPIIIAAKENMATINPLLYPFIIATIKINTKRTSINIAYLVC